MNVSIAAYDPTAPQVLDDPYPFYAAFRRECPVFRYDAANLWIVSRYADVRAVMHDHSSFSSRAMAAAVARPVLIAGETLDVSDFDAASASLIGTDGQVHSRLRQIVNRGFTPRRVAVLAEHMRAIVRSFLDPLLEAGGGDLQATFAVPFPTVVIAEMLGVDPADRVRFRRWAEHMVLAVFEQPDERQRADIGQSAAEMGEWLDAVIDARDRTDGDDLVSVLLRAEADGGALTRDELRGFVFTLLVAGSITTAYLIGNGVLALASHPDQLERARTEPGLVADLVEETLRYDAPTQAMFRTATREVVVAGTTIPKGASVAALLGSANRDESVFREPDRFDVRRGSTEHLAFGHGVHFCLGAALARLEARVAFEELLGRTTSVEIDGPVERVTSMVFRGPTRLPVRLVPARPPT